MAPDPLSAGSCSGSRRGPHHVGKASLLPILVGHAASGVGPKGVRLGEFICLLVAQDSMMCGDPSYRDVAVPGQDSSADAGCCYGEALARARLVGSDPVDGRSRVHKNRVLAVVLAASV